MRLAGERRLGWRLDAFPGYDLFAFGVPCFVAASDAVLGFGSRLLEELRAKTEGRLRVRVAAPRERLFSCWRGGAIVASMHVFGRLAVTAAAFDEDPGAVDRCRFF